MGILTLKKSSRKSSEQGLSHVFLGNAPSESHFAESYRTLQTNICFSFMDKAFRSLLVTSAGQKEGKTSTISNLGYTLAKSGKSVLLVDADLRKPMLSNLAANHSSPGLTGLLLDVFGKEIKSGSLDQMGMSDIFKLLSFQKKSGVLKLTGDKEVVDLFFHNGELKDLNWVTKPEEKKLATILVENGAVSREHIQMAIGRQKEIDQKLGFILISMGLVTENDLKGPLNIQMMEGLRIAYQMKKAVFDFKEQAESDMLAPTFNPINFQKLYQQIIVGDETVPYLKEQIQSAVIEISPQLHLLPSGKIPPNPTDLLGSAKMSYLMAFMKKRYDVILIDSPPVLSASDALLLAPLTDGVMMVIHAGLVNRDVIKKAVDQLRHAKANLIGAVINKADISKKEYYKYYYPYYGERE